MNRIACFLLLVLAPFFLAAQSADSLVRVAKDKNAADSSRVKAFIKLSDLYRYEDVSIAIGYGEQALALADSMNDRGFFRGNARYALATSLNANGQFDSAVVLLRDALDIYSKLGDAPHRAACLNGLGNSYAQTGDYAKALNAYFESLSISTKQGDERRESIAMMNIANVYANRDDGGNAIKFYKQSIPLKEKLNDNEGLLTIYMNMGGVYLDLGQLTEAENCAVKSAELIKDYGVKADSSFLLSLEGKIFLERKQFDKALEKFALGKKIAEETGDTPSMATCVIQTGLVYAQMKDTAKAGPYIREGFTTLQEMGEQPLIEDLYEAVADAYASAGYPEESYHLLKTLLTMQDTVHSRELSELIARKEALFNKEKTQHELDNYKQNALIGDLQLQRSRWLIIVLVLAVIAVLLLVGFLVNRNRIKQSINEKLEQSNAEITTQKNAITDSINYAKKIQDSILPPDSLVHEIIPDSFILYLPKDVVSGDFYWVEKVKGLSIFAAVDCTGHGVPGALMSVIGFNLLTQAVNEMGLTKPADILHHLDFGVNKLLRQSGEGGLVKDGMDLAVCTLDPKTRVLQYAGVFNPVYIITGGELVQIKADKFPIGINTDGVTDDYTNHSMQLQPGDMIYVFSDGYPDQFGGVAGKKYMYNRFRQFLLTIYKLDVSGQKQRLMDEFHRWRGVQEQVDDIIVIGVRVN